MISPKRLSAYLNGVKTYKGLSGARQRDTVSTSQTKTLSFREAKGLSGVTLLGEPKVGEQPPDF